MWWLRHIKERLESHAVPLTILCIITLAVYAPSLRHDFLTNWDDSKYVTANEAVKGFTFAHISTAFSTFYVGNYAPIQILSYMLDYEIWGMRATGFILTNILMHLTNGLLFYRLLVMHAFSRLAAFLAAFIFLLHPVQVESVVWVSQRKNLLAMLLFLASFICYASYSRLSPGEKGRKKLYFISLAAFAGALLTKSVVIVLPLALLLYDFSYATGTKNQKNITDKLPFILLALLIGSITILAQKGDINGGGGLTGYHGGGPFQTFLTMLPVMMLYLKLLLYPVDLSAYYNPEIMQRINLEVAAAGLVVAMLIAFGFVLQRKNRKAAFWYFLFFLCLAPVSQIIPLVTLINDRYLYFPLLGAAAIAGHALALICSKISAKESPLPNVWMPKLVCLLVMSPLMFLPYLSLNRAKVWHDAVTLWTDALQKNPNNELIFTLADAYHGRNDLETAKEMIHTVLDKEPLHPKALHNLALLYMQQNNFVAARTLLLKVTSSHPDFAFGFQGLGNNYYMTGDVHLAEKNYRLALAIKPDLPQTLLSLGNILLAKKEFKEAESCLTKALLLDTSNPDLFYSLACLYSMEGKPSQALKHIAIALKLGYRNKKSILTNSELHSINRTTEFKSLINRYFP